ETVSLALANGPATSPAAVGGWMSQDRLSRASGIERMRSPSRSLGGFLRHTTTRLGLDDDGVAYDARALPRGPRVALEFRRENVVAALARPVRHSSSE